MEIEKYRENGAPSAADGEDYTTIDRDAPLSPCQSPIRLYSLPGYLNERLVTRSVTRFDCYDGELGKLLERNEDEFHRVLGLALQVAEDHPRLRAVFPSQSLDIKHVAALLIGELIVTGQLEGFEEGYE